MLLNQNRNKLRVINEINIVPYVDVMLVLLVIFMITAPALQQAVQVELPAVATGKVLENTKQNPIIITIDKTGAVYLNTNKAVNQALSLTALQQEINNALKINPKNIVLMRADKDVIYDKVVYVMSSLQQAGINNIGLETKSHEQR